jgi:hypothetical protein
MVPWTATPVGPWWTSSQGRVTCSSERSLHSTMGHRTSPWLEESGESDGAELTEGFTSRQGVRVRLATKVRRRR